MIKLLLNCISYSGFDANRRLHTSIRGRYRLDIYKLRIIKRLWSVGEKFSRLRWKAYHKMMIHNHCVLTWTIFHAFYPFFYYSATLWSKHPYQRTVRKLRIDEISYHFFPRWWRIVTFDIFKGALSFWLTFLLIFFGWDLKFSLLSRIFSLITFSTAVSLKEKSGNGSSKLSARKWLLSASRTM